jgi:hypothetical protein
MSSPSSPVLTVRHGSKTTSVTSASLVMLTVERNSTGKPARIVASDDPHVYWTKPGHTPTAGRAREVLWVAGPLDAGEEMRIEPKEGQRHCFAWDAFVLDTTHACVASGPVATGQKLPRKLVWSYNVVLVSPKLNHAMVLDPTIIVQEDP